MPSTWRSLFAGLAALALVACGGSSGPVVLLGPFLVDFESRPDDGFVVLSLPLFLGHGATFSSVTGGSAYDISTADAWGLGGCTAVASSGTLMMAAEQSSPNIVAAEIRLDPPAARVTVELADLTGELVTFEGRNAADEWIGADAIVVGPCPVALQTLSVTSGDENLISILRIKGYAPVWDDLRIWRWSQ